MLPARLWGWTILLAAGFAAAPSLAQDAAAEPEPKAKATVPGAVTDAMAAQWAQARQKAGQARQQGWDKATAGKAIAPHMTRLLELGRKAEQDHPGAPKLADVRMQMMRALSVLMDFAQDEKEMQKWAERMERVASRLAKSDAPAEDRLPADLYLTQRQAFGPDGKATERAPAAIRAVVGKYEGTEVAVQAAAAGIQMAERAKAGTLADEIVQALLKKYKGDDATQTTLIKAGAVPFQAKLPKLGGGELALPKDLKGKVVVLDFWATWCGPCMREVPHMKELYATYKDRGVEFVGISLDRKRDRLVQTVEKREMGWIHIYTGKGWQDPTARKMGVRGIPSIWVLGKDGKVVSANARGKLEEVIKAALKAEPEKKDQQKKDEEEEDGDATPDAQTSGDTQNADDPAGGKAAGASGADAPAEADADK